MPAEEAPVGRDLSALLADPSAAMLELDRVEAEERLVSFFRLCWPLLEPGRALVSGWVLDAIAEHLEAVSAGQINRLLINVPPGTSKSLLVSTLWPAWEWGPRNRPDLRYLLASYAEALALRDNRRCRNVITSALFQQLWGERVRLDPEQNAKGRFDTTARGFRIATSVGGLGTGERGDRFLIDDPHNVLEAESEAVREATLQWFSEVVPTRLNDPLSAIVVIMQRVHARDVSGLILRQELGYEWLCLPMEFEERHRSFTAVPRAGVAPVERALVYEQGTPVPRWIAPEDPVPIGARPVWRRVFAQDRREKNGDWLWVERFPPEYVDGVLKPALRAWGGTYAEAGQLQQRPAPREGGDFHLRDFQWVDAGAIPQHGRTVRGWDLAGSKEDRSAYTVGVKMRLSGGRVYVLDVFRDRLRPHEVEEAIVRMARSDGHGCEISIPVDPGQAGLAQRSTFAGLLVGYEAHFSTESGDKRARARPFAAQVGARNVYLPVGTTWGDPYVNELIASPGGDYLDQVDASSRAFMRLVAGFEADLPSAPPQVVEREAV